jgi:uncharacterized protein (TIGR02453 family)
MRCPIGCGVTEEAALARASDRFSEDTLRFLRELKRNNPKVWFEQNRQRYEDVVVTPALRLIEQLGGSLQEWAPHITPEPRIGGSLFRIQRDTRFSADKSPCKTHVGIRFRDGRFFKGTKCDGPLFYLEFDPARVWLGVGMKAFPSPELGRYRAALSDRRALADLERLVATVEEDGGEIVGERLSRVPAGCPDHPLSLQKGLFASFGLDDVGLVASARFTKMASARFCKHVGFYEWLARHVMDGR